MVRSIAVLGLAVAAAGCVSGAGQESLQRRIDVARDQVYPALVNISVISEEFEAGRQVRRASVGSGAIITPDGYVLTNHHVAGRGKRLVCTLSTREEVPADLVASDPMTDIAMLKLRWDAARGKLPTARFGDSDAIETGDYVLAMGSPLGLSRSVTLGIVSNPARMLGAMEFEGELTGLLTLWIQHDALINPGNSGGPLVNLAGEIVGVNTRGGSGMGLAVPSNQARDVIDQILKRGYVLRSWTGIEPQLLLKQMKEQGMKNGILVGTVIAGSPAAEAGLQAGDVVLSIDGREVSGLFPDDIPRFFQRVARAPVGSVLQVTYMRDGKVHAAAIKTVAWEKWVGEEEEFRKFGFTARNISLEAALVLRLADRSGALVSGVRPDGPFGQAKPAVQAWDVIRKVDSRSMKDIASLGETLKVLAERKEPFLVEVERNGGFWVSVVQVDEKDPDAPRREIPKGWLGVNAQPLTRQLAGALGLEGKTGVRVTQVFPGSPAEKAGLISGDVLVGFGGQPIPVSLEGEIDTFNNMIKNSTIGEERTVELLRDGKGQTVAVVLGASPPTGRELKKYRSHELEFTYRDVAFQDRIDRRWDPSVSGAFVEQVEQAGWAGSGGLAAGDLIRKVQDVEIPDAQALKKALEGILKGKPERVVFQAQRGARSRYLDVEIEWN